MGPIGECMTKPPVGSVSQCVATAQRGLQERLRIESQPAPHFDSDLFRDAPGREHLTPGSLESPDTETRSRIWSGSLRLGETNRSRPP